MEAFDLVIVGAGIHGLAMLKTYKDINSSASILVLDKGPSLGGVWAKERLYPGLRTNNHFRTFEFSDCPMSTAGFNLADDHIPGEHVNSYLECYTDKFDLRKYMRFNSTVGSAVDDGDSGWTLTVSEELAGRKNTKSIKAGKLIVATGLISEPYMPQLQGKETFGVPIYHTSEFARDVNGLGGYKKVVLLSGAKFSWDIAYAYASAGIQVDWVIRESGHGPHWMMPNRLTPLKVIPELLTSTRLVTWLSPCIWGDADGFTSIRSFLHQHWLGRKIVDGFFHKIQHSVEEENQYDSHPETAKLRPWDDVFFVGTNRGLLNYGVDFFEFVRNGTIRVHIADITHLSSRKVHLSSGTTVDADVLICGTGWKDAPQLNFVTHRELGLPGFTTAAAWERYIAQADAEIMKKCPKLQQQPKPTLQRSTTNDKGKPSCEPYRLYRFMVPPAFYDSRTLAFAGACRTPATTVLAQIQALWITAFMDNQMPVLQRTSSSEVTTPQMGGVEIDINEPGDRIKYETVLHSQFGKWRYSRGFGARFPEMWFDCLPYLDLLLRDIGIECHRKGSWWAERFTPYFPNDYKGIVGEYLELKDRKARLRNEKEKRNIQVREVEDDEGS